jgi:hypothetical protein
LQRGVAVRPSRKALGYRGGMRCDALRLRRPRPRKRRLEGEGKSGSGGSGRKIVLAIGAASQTRPEVI